MTGIQITPAYVGLAAKGFAQGQVNIEDAWMRLQSKLTANAGMAGNDTFAHDFDARYSRGLQVAWKAFGSSVAALGGISLGLTTTANNYLKADHHSTTGRGTPPPAYLTPERVAQSITMAPPGSAVGPGQPGLPGFLAKYWPNGHQDRLRAAAAAWMAAAKEVDGVGARLTTTIRDITDTGRRDAHAITDLWARVYSPCNTRTVLGGLAEMCRAMAGACESYAKAIDRAHSSAEHRLAAAGIVIGLTTAIALVLTVFTGGGSDAAGAELDAVEAAAILGPVEAEATTAITEATAVIGDDVVATVETAAAEAPTIEAVEAETTQLETALDEELAQTEGKSLGELGSIDESAKPFGDAERRIADLLKGEGKEVKSLKEVDRAGFRTPDAEVNGVPTEFKSLDPGASSSTVRNALSSAKGQARDAIIDGRLSGISRDEAERGLRRFLGYNQGRMDKIRIIGDGWEINWP